MLVYQRVNPIKSHETTIFTLMKSPFSYGFPMLSSHPTDVPIPPAPAFVSHPTPVGNDRPRSTEAQEAPEAPRRGVATDVGRVYESITEHRDRTKYVCTYIYIYMDIYIYQYNKI